MYPVDIIKEVKVFSNDYFVINQSEAFCYAPSVEKMISLEGSDLVGRVKEKCLGLLYLLFHYDSGF